MDIYKEKYFLYKKKYIELKKNLSNNQKGGNKSNADLFVEKFSSKSLKSIQDERERIYSYLNYYYKNNIRKIPSKFNNTIINLFRIEIFTKYYFDILTDVNKDEIDYLIKYIEECTIALSTMLEKKEFIVPLNMTFYRKLLGNAIFDYPSIFKIIIDKVYNKTFDEFKELKDPLEDLKRISWKELKTDFNKELSIELINVEPIKEEFFNSSLMELYNTL